MNAPLRKAQGLARDITLELIRRAYLNDGAFTAVSRLIQGYMDETGWKPIGTAPTNTPVVVSDRVNWTLGRLVWRTSHQVQPRWPFVVSVSDWTWIFSNSESKPLDFVPTHWMPGPDIPPEEEPHG